MPAKLFAEEPPGTLSAASEKLALNSELTVAPGGLAVSSLIAASTALPLATGASFAGLTTNDAVSNAVENAVEPPLTETSTLLPAVPLVRSQARKVMASLIVPLKLAFGWK